MAEATLQIDSTTLADLEVFESSDGRGGVFEMVDRTTTAYEVPELIAQIGA